MSSTGETVHREKALDFSGRNFRRPPVCARFLRGGTCDKLTVFDNYGFREAVWRKVLWSTCPAKASRLIRLWLLML
jgi:hypothetical protein